jgi:hypothetical protein
MYVCNKINATSVPHHTDKAKNLHYLHFLHRPYQTYELHVCQTVMPPHPPGVPHGPSRGYMCLGRGYLFWPWLFVPGRVYLCLAVAI